jgi:hypothetical protein
MLEWNLPILTAQLLSGFLLICACSGNGDRIPADTTASAAAGNPPAETGASVDTTSADTTSIDKTSARPVAVDTPTVPSQRAGVTPETPQKPIRPSIDPGRKAPPAKPSTPAPAAAPAADPGQESATQGSPLKYDAASNTVTFDLIGGPNGFQFNGYSSGGATLIVPPKANVVMNFINKDGTPHSAEVISGEGSPPNSAVDAAIPRAYTNQLLQGLPQEGSDVMRFQVPDSGTYRIFCGVPGHGLSGMWIWMKVDPAAKTPSFGPSKA